MFNVNLEIIIMPKRIYNVSFIKKNANLFIESQERLGTTGNIYFDISDIDFDKEQSHTYYLLFGYNLLNYKEVAQYSHKMIFMNALYKNLGKIIRNFNFAGIVCMRHLFYSPSYMLGLKTIASKMDNNAEHIPLINNEKYESIYSPKLDLANLVTEYLSLYHESKLQSE